MYNVIVYSAAILPLIVVAAFEYIFDKQYAVLMDIKLSNTVYDKANKQTLVSIGGSQLTIPDSMRVADIEYFLTQKIMNLLRDSMNMVQAKALSEDVEKTTPIQRAMKHYKDLGWDF